MVILGIDPGIATIGYGIIKVHFKRTKRRNKVLKCLRFGCIKTDPTDDFPKRLVVLSKEVRKLVNTYRPKLVAIERIFFFKNKKTAIKVSEAIGAILLTLAKMKVPSIECSPLQVKKFLTKNGRADKKDVQKKVEKILKIRNVPLKDDAADALALSLYVANQT